MANYQNTSGYASNTGSAYGTKAQYSSSSSDGRPAAAAKAAAGGER